MLKIRVVLVWLLVSTGQHSAAQTPISTALLDAKNAVRQQNYNLAVEILSNESFAQSPEVLLLLASLYQTGRGIARDDARSFLLTQSAAILGDADGQYKLGRLHLSGRGTTVNLKEAQVWIARAAEAGHVQAATLLVNLLLSPTAPVVEDKVTETATASPERINVQVSEISERLGWTPIMEATRRGQYKTLEVLTRNSSALNARDKEGRTALIHAAQIGDVKSLNLLIAAGADLNVQDISGKTVLAYGALEGNKQILDLLLEAGADLRVTDIQDRNATLLAIEAGHADLARLMLSHEDRELSPHELETLWISAASYGNAKLMLELVQRGAIIGQADQNRRTALWYAVSQGNLETAGFCIEAGLSANDADFSGVSPLGQALISRQLNMVDLLILANGDPNARTENGNTALMLAARNGVLNLAETLLAAGADIDNQNNVGNSALMLAARHDQADMLQFLLNKGADRKLRNMKRDRARDIAISSGNMRLVKLFD